MSFIWSVKGEFKEDWTQKDKIKSEMPTGTDPTGAGHPLVKE